MVCDGNSQASYLKVESGTCVSGADGAAWNLLLCNEAASSLGFSDTTAEVESSSDDPPGCYWSSSGSGSLWYNTKSSSIDACSSYYPCLCLAPPECTHINGDNKNNAACMCGKTGCASADLYCSLRNNPCPKSHSHAEKFIGSNNWYCYENAGNSGGVCSYSGTMPTPSGSGSWNSNQDACILDGKCLSAPKCAQTDGNEPNNADCICGTKKCTSSSGLYCDKSIRSSTCRDAPKCAQINGNELNNATCICGTKRCTSSSGLYCDKSARSMSCRDVPKCAQVNGDQLNNANCICGTKKCTSSSGLYCDNTIRSSTCRRVPSDHSASVGESDQIVCPSKKACKINFWESKEKGCSMANKDFCKQAMIALFLPCRLYTLN